VSKSGWGLSAFAAADAVEGDVAGGQDLVAEKIVVALESRLVIVSAAAMVGGGQKNEVAVLIDLVEEPPGADAISPCGGIPVFKPLDVRAKMGLLSEMGIDRFP
jgi:hypothetical protein